MTQHPPVFPFNILPMLNETAHTSEKKELKSVTNLRFEHFNTGHPGDKVDLGAASFIFWKSIWQDTFDELGVTKQVWSDDFLHRELVGFFDNNRPVGLVLFRYLDLNRPSHRSVSYFQNHPKDVLDKSFSPCDLTQVSSHITIDKKWTKSQTDYPLSELLISFCLLDFLQNRKAKRMLAYLRNNRGIQNIFYRHGAEALARNVHAYNVDVDFVQITRAKAHLSTLSGCDQLALYFWNQKLNDRKGAVHDDQSRSNTNFHSATGKPHSQNELGESSFI